VACSLDSIKHCQASARAWNELAATQFPEMASMALPVPDRDAESLMRRVHRQKAHRGFLFETRGRFEAPPWLVAKLFDAVSLQTKQPGHLCQTAG
jgi:hypothetical protein